MWPQALGTWRNCIELRNEMRRPNHWSSGRPVSERSNDKASWLQGATPLKDFTKQGSRYQNLRQLKRHIAGMAFCDYYSIMR